MNCIFGPVNSRRLGRSLGIDLFPNKICNLNCIYCEVGRTDIPFGRREVYSDTNDILAEIDLFCADITRLAEVDVVTVTAKGEPTLHLDLGKILRHLKARTNKPLAVLTNGTTLSDPQVRADLLLADIVTPSLDAAREESFRKIDRPMSGMKLADIITGLQTFSHQYEGKLWLEILLAQGINDAPEDIDALIAAICPMRIDRIQLNTVVRPPAETFALAVSARELSAIAERFQHALALPVDLPFVPATKPILPEQPFAEAALHPVAAAETVIREIVKMLQRRPCTAADIDRTFHLNGSDKVEHLLEPLIRSGALHMQEHGGKRFYQIAS
ncbi:MAG: radical SAM protein [Desulfobulbus sp.]|nr:radical SAM protein [Desulfobulbus sp.]